MTGEKNLTELKIPYVSTLTKVNGLPEARLAGSVVSPVLARSFVLSPTPNIRKIKRPPKTKSLLLIVRQVPPFI